MNRKILKTGLLLLSVITVCLLASCSLQQDGVLPGNTEARLGVSSVQEVTEGSATRANTEVIKNGKLWVGVRASQAPSSDYSAKRDLIYDGKDGKWVCSQAVILSQEYISLYAYYPQDGYTINESDEITIEAVKYSKEKDLRYTRKSRENVNLYNPDATFELTHAFARITLSITRDAAFKGTGEISAFALKAAKADETIVISNKVNIKEDISYTASPSAEGFTFVMDPAIVVAEGASANTGCDALLPPQILPDGGIQVSLTIDGVVRSVTIPKSSFPDNGTLKENNRYVVYLEISSNATLTVGTSSVTEEEWKEPTGGDFGGVEDDSGI